jgi:phosphoglucosamine mutase
MRKLFGTDGIRGRANRYPMTGDIAFRLGQAIALKLGKHGSKAIIGKDTRISGYIFEYALTSGLCSMGMDVYLVGPMPTPAIAHLVRSFAADIGIVISASHNPAEDNGIKLFDSKGFKLPDSMEEEIEGLVLSGSISSEHIPLEKFGKAYRIDDAQGRYIEFAKGSIGNASLKGLKVVLDCANGAAYKVAPLILSELGAEVIVFGNKPDGLNINRECGALHIEVIKSAVLGHRAHVGIALDGDADRIIMVDEKGDEFDGDRIMACIAMDMKKRGCLKKDTLVATDYSNLGLDEAMEKQGIKVIRAQNGDRYVVEKLREIKGSLGGEKTGHIVIMDANTTGDGTLTGLHMLRIIMQGKRLSDLQGVLKSYPQVLDNVKVSEKRPFEKMKGVSAAIKRAEAELKGKGRVFIRYSGTENKCRVMLEGKDEAMVKRLCRSIVTEIKKEIGQ